MPRVFLLLTILSVYGCANIVPPEGGPKDTTPPVLLAMSPADSQLNTRVTRIDMRFNKFIEVRDLEKNMQLSPLLETSPTVTPDGKKLVIKISDSLLQENTTYRISLGEAIVDNREYTPFGNFTYTFSTGSYFDSLQFTGQVIDAATGLPDTAATIVLYSETESDSAIVRRKPRYVVKADRSGKFSLLSLPDRSFKAYALYDENNNYYYDGETEKVAFLNELIRPHLDGDSSITPVTFYTFRQVKDTAVLFASPDSTATDSTAVDSLATTSQASSTSSLKSNRLAARRKPAAGAKSGYLVLADTSNIEKRTQEVTAPLRINIYSELSSLDTQKVYLSYDNNGVEVEAIQTVTSDSGNLFVNTQWEYDKVYTLRMVKGWAKDTAGAELAPSKYVFRTKSTEDYSILRIRINNKYYGEKYLLYVYNGKDSIYLKPVTDSLVTLSLLKPGTYGMRIIEDVNGNGQWDPGDLFARRQPEPVIPYYSEMMLKAGWENEQDFSPPENQKKPVKKEPKPPSPQQEEER